MLEIKDVLCRRPYGIRHLVFRGDGLATHTKTRKYQSHDKFHKASVFNSKPSMFGHVPQGTGSSFIQARIGSTGAGHITIPKCRIAARQQALEPYFKFALVNNFGVSVTGRHKITLQHGENIGPPAQVTR